MTNLAELKNIGAGGAGKASGAQQKEYLPIFVPMGYPKGQETMKCGGGEKPVHVADVMTRGQALEGWLKEDGSGWPGGLDLRGAGVGAVYKAYFFTGVCAAATVVTLGWNIYVAAAFAYLTGHYWSNRLLNDAWNLAWYKGKSLIFTK